MTATRAVSRYKEVEVKKLILAGLLVLAVEACATVEGVDVAVEACATVEGVDVAVEACATVDLERRAVGQGALALGVQTNVPVRGAAGAGLGRAVGNVVRPLGPHVISLEGRSPFVGESNCGGLS